jgi:polyadenylation factor subunit 2
MKEFEMLRGQNSDVCTIGWHPQHESLLLSGGYNGSLIYWIVGHNQAPHTLIADAHRQSVDVIAWHPAGHVVGTASHDGILKFWSREPPGSKLEQEVKEFQDNPVFMHGPVEVGVTSVIPPMMMSGMLPGAEVGSEFVPPHADGASGPGMGRRFDRSGGPGASGSDQPYAGPRGDRPGRGQGPPFRGPGSGPSGFGGSYGPGGRGGGGPGRGFPGPGGGGGGGGGGGPGGEGFSGRKRSRFE